MSNQECSPVVPIVPDTFNYIIAGDPPLFVEQYAAKYWQRDVLDAEAEGKEVDRKAFLRELGEEIENMDSAGLIKQLNPPKQFEFWNKT